MAPALARACYDGGPSSWPLFHASGFCERFLPLVRGLEGVVRGVRARWDGPVKPVRVRRQGPKLTPARTVSEARDRKLDANAAVAERLMERSFTQKSASIAVHRVVMGGGDLNGRHQGESMLGLALSSHRTVLALALLRYGAHVPSSLWDEGLCEWSREGSPPGDAEALMLALLSSSDRHRVEEEPLEQVWEALIRRVTRPQQEQVLLRMVEVTLVPSHAHRWQRVDDKNLTLVQRLERLAERPDAYPWAHALWAKHQALTLLQATAQTVAKPRQARL